MRFRSSTYGTTSLENRRRSMFNSIYFIFLLFDLCRCYRIADVREKSKRINVKMTNCSVATNQLHADNNNNQLYSNIALIRTLIWEFVIERPHAIKSI